MSTRNPLRPQRPFGFIGRLSSITLQGGRGAVTLPQTLCTTEALQHGAARLCHLYSLGKLYLRPDLSRCVLHGLQHRKGMCQCRPAYPQTGSQSSSARRCDPCCSCEGSLRNVLPASQALPSASHWAGCAPESLHNMLTSPSG